MSRKSHERSDKVNVLCNLHNAVAQVACTSCATVAIVARCDTEVSPSNAQRGSPAAKGMFRQKTWGSVSSARKWLGGGELFGMVAALE